MGGGGSKLPVAFQVPGVWIRSGELVALRVAGFEGELGYRRLRCVSSAACGCQASPVAGAVSCGNDAACRTSRIARPKGGSAAVHINQWRRRNHSGEADPVN